MDRDEIRENIAWAKRVLAAPEAKTGEQLLARALLETSEQLHVLMLRDERQQRRGYQRVVRALAERKPRFVKIESGR